MIEAHNFIWTYDCLPLPVPRDLAFFALILVICKNTHPWEQAKAGKAVGQPKSYLYM
jgi:hypothetical protein